MEKQQIKTGSLMFVTGLLVGGITTALYAPRSGKETREEIKQKAHDVQDDMKHKANRVQEGLKSMKEEIKQDSKDLKQTAEQEFTRS